MVKLARHHLLVRIYRVEVLVEVRQVHFLPSAILQVVLALADAIDGALPAKAIESNSIVVEVAVAIVTKAHRAVRAATMTVIQNPDIGKLARANILWQGEDKGKYQDGLCCTFAEVEWFSKTIINPFTSLEWLAEPLQLQIQVYWPTISYLAQNLQFRLRRGYHSDKLSFRLGLTLLTVAFRDSYWTLSHLACADEEERREMKEWDFGRELERELKMRMRITMRIGTRMRESFLCAFCYHVKTNNKDNALNLWWLERSFVPPYLCALISSQRVHDPLEG